MSVDRLSNPRTHRLILVVAHPFDGDGLLTVVAEAAEHAASPASAGLMPV
jgi:hypothetical protein